MMIIALLAASALAHIRTLPAYAEYRAAVEACSFSLGEEHAQALRGAFQQTKPNRDITSAVEQQIASQVAHSHACLNEVGERVRVSAAHPGTAAAYGSDGAAPWLADIGKRKARVG